jgi:hypothetical protein
VLAQLTDPRLSTVRQPVDAMAERMIQELLARIADPGREPAHSILETQLALRDSTAPRDPQLRRHVVFISSAGSRHRAELRLRGRRACRHVAGLDCSLSPM